MTDTTADHKPAAVRHTLELTTDDDGKTWTARQTGITDGSTPILSRPLHLAAGDTLTISLGVGNGTAEIVDRAKAAEHHNRQLQARIRADTARTRMLTAHTDVLLKLLADFASQGHPAGTQVRRLLAHGLTDPGYRDEFLNRNSTVRDAVGGDWLECPTGNCPHSRFMHDDGPDPRCRARDCQGEECGPEGSTAVDDD